MKSFVHLLIVLCLVTCATARESDRLELARLQTGAAVSFVHFASDEWGLEITGGPAPRISQAQPARLELSSADGEVRQVAAGYKTIRKFAEGIDAVAEISYGDTATFRITDRWAVNGAVLSVHRKVEVRGNAPGGFNSAITLSLDRAVPWTDVSYMAPGVLYGDPTHDGERSPGGTLNNAAHRYQLREDFLPAPLFALSFHNGASISVLDPAPRGDSTFEETKLTKDTMTDARFQFGALGAWQDADAPIQFGFWFPGSVTTMYMGGPPDAKPRTERRYHPIENGVNHSYEAKFRFGQNESFADMTRNSWRWAWSTLKPAVTYIDVEQMRRVLIDHLQAHSATIDGRTAIPFVLSTMNDDLQWNWTMVAMGFVGKEIECADQLLREGDRDPTERGKKMRETGLAIISSLIRALPTVPLQATGYDLADGKPWDHIWLAPWLRNSTEDMRVLMRAYRREHALGREHPDWLKWVKSYVDWLILQQREDGSFARRWKSGSNDVAEASGTASYAPVPLLVILSEVTGDPKYRQAAIRAADYIWSNYGSRGLFVGGASDNPNVTDKEAGMLSMEAFLSLYDSTKESKWLDRAKVAANFAETWIWIWNLPMPLDAENSQLYWKKGVPTTGTQGITVLAAGSADEYLDWAVPSYAKLYNYTKDQHYLEVARVLLHDTKSMVALPGRQYDMKGIGWQQEGWRFGPGGPGRGVGGHRFWLPWISANHLYGITGLEEYDPVLFRKLSANPAASRSAARKNDPDR